MERLTFEGNFCDIAQCRELPCLYNGACSQRKVWERLKAYENTGLTPKEAKRMSNILMDVGIDYNCSWEYVKNWLLDDRLRELAEADKDERVVVLPCKPGDTVYSIFGAEVIEKTVGRVIINGYTTPRIWVDLDCSFLSSVTKRWDLGIGKDFFLTREDAEKALEAMKGG
jgi:hypothetical protein